MFRYIRSCLSAKTCLRQVVKHELNTRQNKCPLPIYNGTILHIRNKYVTSGIQGRRNSKVTTTIKDYDEDELEVDSNTISEEKISLKDRYTKFIFLLLFYNMKLK